MVEEGTISNINDSPKLNTMIVNPGTNTAEFEKENQDIMQHLESNNPNAFAVNESGLRRSARVPKPRADLKDDLEEEYKKRAYKKRAKPKPKGKAKGNVKKSSKKVIKKKSGANGKSAISVTSSGSKNDAKKSITPGVPNKNDLQEPSLTNANWAPCNPLLNSDFKTHQSVSSRLKNPNMRSVPYAGDIIKIMSFLNKFYSLFDPDLLNLSFQDFEVGLNIYPGNTNGSADGLFSESKNRVVYYQDYILVKEVIKVQDKMNLLLLTLLQLLFVDPKKYDPPTLGDISSRNVFKPFVEKLRKSAIEWGYPKEWRSTTAVSDMLGEGKFAIFPTNDAIPVDTSNSEILTPNVYTWAHNEPLDVENDPLSTDDIIDEGILGISPDDRIIFLRALVDWCGGQSLLIHHEVYQLTHFKREPTFGVQTQHVPRYYMDGPEITYNYFKKLCTIIQSRYEIRSKKKHYRKQLNEGKNEDLKEKLALLEEIKTMLDNVEKSKKGELVISLYDKWVRLFEGELSDNPLSDPFEDPIYTLRSQEFFVGRVPYMGDFYLPRLHTYGDTINLSSYTNLRSLENLVGKFKNKEYTAFHLFEDFGQTMSSEFKVLYHDTPSLLHDMTKNKNIEGKNYWFEMCHNSETLREFIDFLEFKIVKPVEKVEPVALTVPLATAETDTSSETGAENIVVDSVVTENLVTEIPIADDQIKKESEMSNINTNPLPRDARYNTSRKKLKILKEYLSDFYYIFYTFEQLKHEYGDMKPGRRQLRTIKRSLVNYNMDYDSDDMEE